MSIYPFCKSCSFLAIDYYEEISNTHEDCLSEALIPESVFLSNENNYNAFIVDESYKSPWKNALYDEDYINNEANKVEESVEEITKNALLVTNDFKWIPNCDDNIDYFKTFNKKLFKEKDLSIFRAKVLHGKFQFLDVPDIPFSLPTPKTQSLISWISLLPMMEIDDSFFKDVSFEDNDTFFNVDPNDGKRTISQFVDERKFYKQALPELRTPEISNFQDIVQNCRYLKNNEDIEEYESKKDFIKSSCPLLQTSDNIMSTSACKIHKKYQNVDMIKDNSFMQNKCIESNQQSSSNTRVCDLTLNSDTIVDDCIDMIIDNDNLDGNLNNLKDTCSLYENVITSDEVCFQNEAFDMQQQEETISLIPIETLSNIEFNQSSVQDVQAQFETLPIINSSITDPYKEKLSKLQYTGNYDIKSPFNSEVINMKSRCAPKIKYCTAFRKENLLPQSSQKLLQENSSKSCSQNMTESQPVNLLSNFIQAQFPFRSSKELSINTTKASVKSPICSQRHSKNLVSRQQVTNPDPCEKDKSISMCPNHFQEESIPVSAQLEAEDLLVELPADYVKLLLMLQDSAIPLLQTLMLSEKFKFRSNLTLADIPHYKTCFLLNQEVKHCQDKQINKESMSDYYTNLLTLHGILKTLEYLIHFDVHQAIVCLREFDVTHRSLIKGYHRKLIEKFEHDVDECFQNDSIHPKIKEFCQYLNKKYEFCKENQLKFKALVIFKRNLETVYATFEKVLRQDDCNFRIYHIPESVFLHSTTLIFKSKEDTAYFINESSLSNDIPWTDLSLVIEFESENNSCWKQICYEQNIAHAFVKVINLPLKSLEEIRSLKVTDKKPSKPLVENIRLLIVSASITSQYQLLYLLESKFQFSICIRQYKEILPHLHFADIVIDEKSAVVLVSDISFTIDDFSEALLERVSFLYIKFETCWIIVQRYIDKKSIDVSKCMKYNICFLRFHSKIVNLCHKIQLYKIKILFTHNVEETSDLIKDIFCISVRNKDAMNNLSVSIPSQITKEEIFLSSFPSLNPFVINLMLTEYNLSELLNLSFDVMRSKFSSIPERFLRCFYSTIHKCYVSTTPENYEEPTDIFENSSYESSESNSKFELKPNFQMMPNSPNLDYLNTNVDETREQVYDKRILPKYLNNAPCYNAQHCMSSSQEKSLEELDLEYMSLKICNKYEEYQSSFDEEEFPSSNNVSSLLNSNRLTLQEGKQDISPSFTFETLSSQISNESHLSFDSNAELEKSIDSTYKHLLKAGATSSCVTNTTNANIEHEFPVNFSTQNSQHTSKRALLDLNQFKYAPNKRKLLLDDASSKQIQKKPCNIQKGMTSKTVSKQDLIYKSPFDSQEMLPSPSPNRKEAKVFPFMIRPHDNYESSKISTGRITQMKEGMNSFDKYRLSQWSDSEPVKGIPLTPRTNRRLRFEKAPGLAGQTRLVFQ